MIDASRKAKIVGKLEGKGLEGIFEEVRAVRALQLFAQDTEVAAILARPATASAAKNHGSRHKKSDG